MNFLNILTSTEFSLASILYPMAIGIVLATCIAVFNKQTLGRFVKKLFDERASDENSAKTLAELGFEKNKIVKFSLREGSILRKVVKVASYDSAGSFLDNEDGFREGRGGILNNEVSSIEDKGDSPDIKGSSHDKKGGTPDDTARYYIPDECLRRAEVLYCPDGSSILTVIIALVIVIALCTILLTLIPDIVQMVKNVGDKFKSL